jgi:phage baseplate assembly protein V
MNFNLADLSRRLENIVRLGTIFDVRHSKKPHVRVKLGEIVTDWLPVVTLRAGDTKTWSPTTKGEQCIVFSPSGDLGAGAVLVGINSQHNEAPDDNPDNTRTEYKDGALVEYNHHTHTGKVIYPSDSKLMIDVAIYVHVTTPLVNVTGSLKTSENLSAGTGASGSFTTPTGQVVTVLDGIITNIF